MHENFNLIINAAAAIIGGAISGVAISLLHWWNRPKLQLRFEQESGKLVSTFDVGGKPNTEIFIKIELQNVGRGIAERCQVFLTGIQEVNNTSLTETNFHESMQLAWPGWPKDFEPRSLPPKVRLFADVVSVNKAEPGWRFQVKGLYASQKQLKEHRGTYRMHILATALNARPTSLKIDVYYDQDWHSLRAGVTQST